MRRDVLELMAEEIAGRPVDALASFLTWDDGRRKLDGMAKGRRWDIDREHGEMQRETKRVVQAVITGRYRQRHPAKALASLAASRKKHKARRNAESLAWYYANRNRARANKRRHYLRTRVTTSSRRCATCAQPGHDRRTCGAT